MATDIDARSEILFGHADSLQVVIFFDTVVRGDDLMDAVYHDIVGIYFFR